MTIILLALFARAHVIDRGIAPSLLIFDAVLVIATLVFALNVTFARVTLYPDRIERTTWFGRKSLLRADVFKLERRGKFRVPILLSKTGLFNSIQLPTGVEEDAAWKAWMTIANDGNTAHANGAHSSENRS
jgi:hypothetical protein